MPARGLTGELTLEIRYPLEVVVEGTPISLQGSSRSRARWKRKVAVAARMRLQELRDRWGPDERPVAVTIFYFPIAPLDGDIDNLIKPILDGLEGIVYKKDQVVERVLVQKFEPGIVRPGSVASVQLGRALEAEPPVVFIRIEDGLVRREIA